MDTTPASITPTWPPPWARGVGFAVGLGLIGWEAVLDQSTHMVVYVLGFILTGLPIAAGIEKVLDRILPGGRS